MEIKNQNEKGLSDGQWSGQSCFVVLGGPSLKSFNWLLLERLKNIIVVNRAYAYVPHADIFITEDERFIRRFSSEESWKIFQGMKILSLLDEFYRKPVEEADPEVVFLSAREKRYGWGKSLSDGLSSSSNSGVPALNLADILGANPIYVLGLDCKPTGDLISNFHEDYPIDWRVNGHQLESFGSDFTYWAAPNLRGKTIINLNKDSGVKIWPTVDCSYNMAITDLIYGKSLIKRTSHFVCD